MCDSCGLTLDFVQNREGNLIPPEDQDDDAEADHESEDFGDVPDPTQVEGRCVACGEVLDENCERCPSCGLVYSQSPSDDAESEQKPESEITPLCPSALARMCPVVLG
jgi:hypothetical protein